VGYHIPIQGIIRTGEIAIIRIKESGNSLLKPGRTGTNWLKKISHRKDAFGRTANDVFREHDVQVVDWCQEADFGFSMYGNYVEDIPMKRCILYKTEPPIYNLYFGVGLNRTKFLNQYMAVFSNSKVESNNYEHIHAPLDFYLGDKKIVDEYFDKPKDNLLCMMLRNKKTSMKINGFIPGLRKYNKYNLTPYRIEMDNAFCDSIPNDYHSYGRGWNEKCFKGDGKSIIRKNYSPIKERFEVISKYKFNFCPENSMFNGYVTEKPFQAMLSGSIPIYKGAPDVDNILPIGSFIDAREFETESLIDYIKNMTTGEYNAHRKRMKKFVTSKESNIYSSYNFAKRLVKVLEDNT